MKENEGFLIRRCQATFLVNPRRVCVPEFLRLIGPAVKMDSSPGCVGLFIEKLNVRTSSSADLTLNCS